MFQEPHRTRERAALVARRLSRHDHTLMRHNEPACASCRCVLRELGAVMAFGGGGDGGDALLIGWMLDWWDKHTTKRDARRAARAEAKLKKQANAPQSDSQVKP